MPPPVTSLTLPLLVAAGGFGGLWYTRPLLVDPAAGCAEGTVGCTRDFNTTEATPQHHLPSEAQEAQQPQKPFVEVLKQQSQQEVAEVADWQSNLRVWLVAAALMLGTASLALAARRTPKADETGALQAARAALEEAEKRAEQADAERRQALVQCEAERSAREEAEKRTEKAKAESRGVGQEPKTQGALPERAEETDADAYDAIVKSLLPRSKQTEDLKVLQEVRGQWTLLDSTQQELAISALRPKYSGKELKEIFSLQLEELVKIFKVRSFDSVATLPPDILKEFAPQEVKKALNLQGRHGPEQLYSLGVQAKQGGTQSWTVGEEIIARFKSGSCWLATIENVAAEGAVARDNLSGFSYTFDVEHGTGMHGLKAYGMEWA